MMSSFSTHHKLQNQRTSPDEYLERLSRTLFQYDSFYFLTTQQYETPWVLQFSKRTLHTKHKPQKRWHKQRRKAQAQKQEPDLKPQKTGLKSVYSGGSHNNDPGQKELFSRALAVASGQKGQTLLSQRHKSPTNHKELPLQNRRTTPRRDFEENTLLSRQQRYLQKRYICESRKGGEVLPVAKSFLSVSLSHPVYVKSVSKPRERAG